MNMGTLHCTDVALPCFLGSLGVLGISIRAAVISNSFSGAPLRAAFVLSPVERRTRAKEGKSSKIKRTKDIHPFSGTRGKGTYEAIMTGVDPFMGFDIIT